MRDLLFDNNLLIKFQRWFWRITFIYFLINTLILTFNSTLAGEITFWGIILLLLGTLIKLIIFIINFQKIKQYRFSILSYLLIFILASTVILKYWIL
ncbi:MAG: hypothetical protein U9N54_10740 [candidate division Zixibacteria bacterium]|nr:hypothetical protein [candidate division Zixibacteria bacterium]